MSSSDVEKLSAHEVETGPAKPLKVAHVGNVAELGER